MVPGSIPGSCGSFLGHFLVMSGSFFRHFWDMLGHVWGYFGDVFGWVWDGFGKMFRKGRKNEILKFVREYFSSVGLLVTIIFSRSPDTNTRKFEIVPLFVYIIVNIIFYRNSRSTALGGLYVINMW